MTHPTITLALLLAYLSAMTLATSYVNATYSLERLNAQVAAIELTLEQAR